MFMQRNPVLQIVYLSLLCGGYLVAIFIIFPEVPNLYVSNFHKYTFSALLFFTLHRFYKACSTQPGYITAETLERYDNYRYDNQIFYRTVCRTTGIRKPARSKFCSIMGCNVARYDHYCGWIAQPVGEENHFLFLQFVSLTAVTLLYAGWCLGMTLWSVITEKKLFEAMFVNRATGERTPASVRLVLQYLMGHKNILCGLTIITIVMGVVIFFFTLYHLYLIGSNMTTNESNKWADLSFFVDKAQYILEVNAKKREEAVRNGDNPEFEKYYNVPEKYSKLIGKDLVNIYDRGIFANFREIIYPRSLAWVQKNPKKAKEMEKALLKTPVKFYVEEFKSVTTSKRKGKKQEDKKKAS
eukprot:g1304.t1